MSDHLSEESIQLYLDNQESPDYILIREHLDQCLSCTKKMEEYKQIFEALTTDPFPPLPNNFSKNVVSAISGNTESRWQFFESGSIIAFFLFGIAASLYFVNPLPFLTDIAQGFLNNLAGYLSRFLPESTGYLPIVIAVILIFLLVEIVDKKVLRSRS